MLRNLKIIFLSLLFLSLSFSDVFAYLLTLPHSAGDIKKSIMAQCPECLKQGFMTCGNKNIQYGKKFAYNFFKGNPPRGYLITPVIESSKFRKISRRINDLKQLKKYLHKEFSKLKILVVNDNFSAARIIESPVSVEVIFPENLFSCLKNKEKKWGCCVSPSCEQECCEKSLGSPIIKVKWVDHQEGEILILKYWHPMGGTYLKRIRSGQEILYNCLTDGPGYLKSNSY